MKLRHLWYFKVLAERGHLTNASKILMISPPALRGAIRAIEEEYHCRLFDHVGRNIVLNEKGRALLAHVNVIFNELDQAENELRMDMQAPDDTRLRLGVVSPTLWYREIQGFLSENPSVVLEQRMLSRALLADAESCRKLDLVLGASGDLPYDEWDAVCICYENPPLLAVNPKHPFAGRKRIRLVEARNEIFIRITQDASSRGWEDNMFRLAGFQPQESNECHFSLRASMLAANRGVLLTTRSVAETGSLGDAVFLEISEPKLYRPYFIFWQRHKTLGGMAKRFREFIINAMDRGKNG